LPKRTTRPIDVKDVPWSHIGKDELDKAAETLWEALRIGDGICTIAEPAYHVQSSATQDTVQRAVLALLGNTVPNLLRDRASAFPYTSDESTVLRELADELEEEHGV
jgi:hypothetical protein